MAYEYDYLFKIILIGDSGVGKSALLMRYCDESFIDSYISTIGVDFKIKTIELDGRTIKLQMWDTAGQERFKSIVSSYYRGAQGVLLCFNVEDPESFVNVKKWMVEVNDYCQTDTIKILVGTKADRRGDAHKFMNAPAALVDRESIDKFAEEHGVIYIETSAKKDKNCNLVFEQLSMMIRDTQKSINTSQKHTNPFRTLTEPKKSNCC